MSRRGKAADIRPGMEFQNLLAIIENAISRDGHTKVESPAYLVDHASKTRREFDVLITFEKGHHRNLTAIECKDHGRKIDIGVIDAFAAKLADCGVHRGIIVSAAGFTDPVLTKAKSKGIQLMTLQEAVAFDWLLAPTILTTHRVVNCTNAMFGVPGSKGRIAEPYQVFTTDGSPLTPERLRNLALRVVPDSQVEVGLDATEEFNVLVKVPDVYLVDAHGVRHDVTEIAMRIETIITNADVPLALHSYSGEGVSTMVAMAEMPNSPVDHKLIMIRAEDGIRVGFVPKPQGKPR